MNAGPAFREWLDRHFPIAAKDRGGYPGCAPSQLKRAGKVLNRAPSTISMYASGRHPKTGRPVGLPADVRAAMAAHEAQAAQQEQER